MPASIRDYVVLRLGRRGVIPSSGYVGGGSILLETGQHDLDGAEHTGQLPIERISTSETDPTLVVAPDGLGGLTFIDPAEHVFHPVMAQDPGGLEPDRWWVVTDGSGTAVMAEG